ncbi:MAG TPA: hypothetical protein VIS48_13525 [Candidatus Kryptonia bacterium]
MTIAPEKPREVGVIVRTLRFVFAWDTHSMGRLYVPQSPCGGVVQDNPRYGTDSVVIEVPQGYPGDYAFDPQVGVGLVPKGEPIHATFSIYINDTMVQHDSTVLFGSGSELYSPWPNGWIYYNPPWFSQFNFELSAKLIPYSTDTHPIISGMNDCGGTSWSPLDQMTLTIESGIGYASFYGYDLSNGTYDIPFGNKAEGTGADIAGNILLSATGTVPGKDGQWILVKASSNGIVKVDSTLVTPPPDLDHFTVQLQPDTIAYSEQSKILVQAKDKDRKDFFLDGDILISVDPPGYGEISYMMPGIVGSTKNKMGLSSHEVQNSDSIGGKANRVTDGGVKVPYSAANSGWVFFNADGTIPDTNTTITFTASGVDEPSATGTGSVVIRGTKPELVVIYPTDELKATKEITKDPTMPDITAKAKLENYKGGTVNFQWNLQVQWEGPDGREFNDSFRGNTTATNSQMSPWTINWTMNSSKIRGGDELTLDVTATAGGKVYDKTVDHGFIIVGLNPSKSAIKSAITESDPLAIEVIIFMESSWRQFIKNKDFPLWGYPNGYGLMQLDNSPAATDEQVWDWKENLAGGEAHFEQAKSSAIALPATYRSRQNSVRMTNKGYQSVIKMRPIFLPRRKF